MTQKEILDYLFSRREELARKYKRSENKAEKFEYISRWKELGLLVSLITNGVQK